MNNIFKISEDGKTLLECLDKNITEATIPKEVTTIGRYAFYECRELESISIHKGVTTIEAGAFNHCISLQKIHLPQHITTIEDMAFFKCSSLKKIYIPNSVTSIGKCAFCSCSALQYVYIPQNVTFIGTRAFSHCHSLQEIYVATDNVVFSSSEGVLFNKSMSTLICFPGKHKDKYYKIPYNVKTIADGAFCGCSSLQNIDFPPTIRAIDNNAFWECSSLTNISLPDSIVSIGNYVFENCFSLKTIDIPNSVIYIGKGTFRNCYSLQSIDIPSDVISIGEMVFYGCSSLQNINVALESLTYQSLDGVLFDKRMNKIICFPRGYNKEHYKIPYNVQIIDKGAFEGCTSLKSIEIPSTIKLIDDNAFYDCSSLQSISIPNNAMQFGEYVFHGCSSLKKMVTYIVDINRCAISNATFDDFDFDNCTLYIPIGSCLSYRKHPVLSRFKNIKANTWKLVANTLMKLAKSQLIKTKAIVFRSKYDDKLVARVTVGREYVDFIIDTKCNLQIGDKIKPESIRIYDLVNNDGRKITRLWGEAEG